MWQLGQQGPRWAKTLTIRTNETVGGIKNFYKALDLCNNAPKYDIEGLKWALYKLHEVTHMNKLSATLPTRRRSLVGLFIITAVLAGVFGGAKPAAASNPGAMACESIARTAPSTGWRASGDWATVEPFRKTVELNTNLLSRWFGGELNNASGKTFWFGVNAKGLPNHEREPMVRLECYAYVSGKWYNFGRAMLPGQVSADKTSVSLKPVLTPELCAKIIEEAAKKSSQWTKALDNQTITLNPVLRKYFNGDLATALEKFLGAVSYQYKNSWISAQLGAVKDGQIPAKCFVYDEATKSDSSAGGLVSTKR
jgi:hypothetical protein